MAYTLIYSGNQTGNREISVPDGTVSSVGNIVLPGKNFSGYGQSVDQNMLSMVENWASSTGGPNQPVTGQIWYDTSTTTLKYNVSTVPVAEWAIVPSVDANGNLTLGNLTLAGNLIVDRPGAIYGDIVSNTITTGSTTLPGTITGNWTLTAGSRLNATYADLAERHHSDGEYAVGTVMKVGGENEVTAASVGDRVLGVVSAEYAYLMNSEAGSDDTHPAIAYVGRVPVRIVGPINKHEQIVPTLSGCARAARAEQGFGWALETNDSPEEKLVLCVIK